MELVVGTVLGYLLRMLVHLDASIGYFKLWWRFDTLTHFVA